MTSAAHLEPLRFRPIVKWAGGKTRLLASILRRVPQVMNTYAEPFAGGAAVFFCLAERGRIGKGNAVLADQNDDLIACYRAVRDQVEDVIEALGRYHYDRDLFYEVRAKDPTGMDDVERGARLLFLNRTCYNGLWRVNSKGCFNVPFGRYHNPTICDREGLRAAAIALRGVRVVKQDFAAVAQELREGDFAYFDPPYVPVSKTASFTSYGAGGFDEHDQARLVHELESMRERGAMALLSNADTVETRALYRNFAATVVTTERRINSDVGGRGKVRELLVATWGRPGMTSSLEAPDAPRSKLRRGR